MRFSCVLLLLLLCCCWWWWWVSACLWGEQYQNSQQNDRVVFPGHPNHRSTTTITLNWGRRRNGQRGRSHNGLALEGASKAPAAPAEQNPYLSFRGVNKVVNQMPDYSITASLNCGSFAKTVSLPMYEFAIPIQRCSEEFSRGSERSNPVDVSNQPSPSNTRHAEQLFYQ